MRGSAPATARRYGVSQPSVRRDGQSRSTTRWCACARCERSWSRRAGWSIRLGCGWPRTGRCSGDDLVGPKEPLISGTPDAVWLTAESLGARDPALIAWPEAPVVFVFDEPLLDRLQLSSKRLVFIAETLAELAEHRKVQVLLDDPVRALKGVPIASTFAPVPGYQTRVAQLKVVATHPYSWLARPEGGDVRSHSAWTRQRTRPRSTA